MSETRISRRRCPRCGWAIARIPRRPEDRIATDTAPIRRYSCCHPGGCGWEGTLVATWADTRVERRRLADGVRVRPRQPAKRRFVLCAVISLAAFALCGAGVTVYGTYSPTSFLTQNAGSIPLGVSDFGRPLPDDHPFLQQDIAGRPRAVNTAGAATAPSAGTRSDDAPLLLRQDCAWGEPGRNPYQGTVRQALNAARLPAEVVTLLERKIEERESSDRLEIHNDKIRAVNSETAFEPTAIKMTYGKTLCLNSRVNFKPGHMERADLYEVADARGMIHSVMVPDVCGNVSVLGPHAERNVKPQGITASKGEPRAPGAQNLVDITPPVGGNRLPELGAPGVQTLVDITPPGGNRVPEPETWTLMLVGVTLLAWFTRR